VSNYRPITDIWILARPKVNYYGAYPNGFLERAKALLGVTVGDSVLHVCGGAVKRYPAWAKLCPSDLTLDLDGTQNPDIIHDVRTPIDGGSRGWDAILCDPPYTEADADKYAPGSAAFPAANQLLRNALAAVRIGGRVGMLHYLLPQPPRHGVKFVACVAVIVGYNNRIRCYSVFERIV
jgi:hypothetical protein